MICKICRVNDKRLLTGDRFGGISDNVYLKMESIYCGREPEMSCYRDTSS